MEITFQLIDCDYVLVDGLPTVRIFGKTEEGRTVCVFSKNHLPYFYAQVKNNLDEQLVLFVKKNFPAQLVKVERVEKFLTKGYQEKPTELIKITIKDPSQVSEMRDILLQQNFINEIFEADILFKYRFMVDNNLFGMQWYKTIGSPTKTKTVRADKTIEASQIIPSGDKPTSLRVASIDIEVVTDEGLPDATKTPIAIISFSFSPEFNGRPTLVLVAKPTEKTNGDVLIFKDEKEMLQEFLRVMENFDPDVITGYNINNFDIPYIVERLSQNKLSKSLGRDPSKPLIPRKIAGSFRNSTTGRIIVDVYSLIKEMQTKTQLAEKGFSKLKRYGLGDVSYELLKERKLDITHSDMPKIWNGNQEENREQMRHFIDYARKDAELAMKLLLKLAMVDKFIELSKVSGLLLQDSLDSGEAARVENILLREFNKSNFVLPLKPESREILHRAEERIVRGFKGALVLEPIAGLHTKPVIYLDFKSMYPSIFVSYNLCPSTIIFDKNLKTETIETPDGVRLVSKNIFEGVMPRVVKQLILERDRVRDQAKKTPDEAQKKLLEAKQIAIKYMTNSFYGYTGYDRARLYMLDIASAITACGRFLIDKTKKFVEQDKKFVVIYGDTDSIMVKVDVDTVDEAWHLGQELEKKINDELAGIVQMKIESVFRSILILSKKRYAGMSLEKSNDGWHEKMMMKGIETVRRDWCDLTSETLYSILEIILKEQNPKKALAFMRDVITKIEKNQVDIDKLVVTKSLSKSLQSYKGIQPHVELVKKMRKRDIANAPGVGDRIGFVIIQGTKLLSERAEDPEYVKKNKLKVDSKYYVETQLLPPLERVFEAMGVTRSEILNAGKQMLLTQAIANGTKKPAAQVLHEIDGFMCDKCSKQYKITPMSGKCFDCGGEIMFFKGDARSRYFSP